MPKSRFDNSVALELAKQLLTGVLGWSSHELKLAKLDARTMLNRYLFGLGLLFASFTILTAAIFTLAETLVGALADYVQGDTFAGLIVSGALFGITALTVAVARSFLTKKPTPQGMVFRRLLGRARDE